MLKRWALVGAVLVLGCARRDAPKAVEERVEALPPAPLELSLPPLPSAIVDGQDLSTLGVPNLRDLALAYYQQGQPARAAQVGRWAVERGADARYDLACFYALAGQADAAYYYLQQATLLEGVDGAHAAEDPDLALLRQDAQRWAAVARHITLASAYWRDHAPLRTTLVRPRDAAADRALPLVIGLHGLGHNETFIDDDFQGWADALGVAFVAVSGTRARGPRSFSWAEQVDQDWAHVSAALDGLKGRLSYQPGRVMLFGFSQGAATAFAIAAAHPEIFSGAVALSPGTLRPVADVLSPLKARPESARQRYAVVAGAGENPQTVETTKVLAAWAQSAGAQVQWHLYPDQDAHTFPADFAEAFPRWVRGILRLPADGAQPPR